MANAAAEAGFASVLSWEYARVFTRPWTDLLTLVGNALLVSAFWIFLPSHLTNWVFSLHGPVAFAVILEVWMLADTLLTNPFGASPGQVLTRIDSRRALEMWLWARSFVIWSFVGPVCAIVAIALGVGDHHVAVAVLASVVLLIVPFAIISITAWVGILYPYHPRSLIWRWQHRRGWRVLLRWAVLLALPYYLVLTLSFALLAPSIAVADILTSRDPSGRLSLAGVVLEVVIACAVAITVALVGHRVAVQLAIRRRDKLVAYLTNPDNG